MKKISIIIITGVLSFLIVVQSYAQNISTESITIIDPYRLQITFNKTTNLIFPYAIKSVDRGSSDILVQRVRGIDNILQLKAAKLGFEETNLTVVTADGKLYSYNLDYSDSPEVFNIRFGDSAKINQEAFFSTGTINELQMRTDAEIVIREKKNVNGIKNRSYGVKVQMEGIFIHDNVLYCRIRLQNNTNINYGIDQLRFYIRDQKRSKRTATQELEVKPLYIKGDTSEVIGQAENLFVFALPKFTIPDKKFLIIEIMEKSGGRNLKLIIGNKTIVRATLLR